VEQKEAYPLHIGNYSIRKTATSVPDFQQTGIGRFLLLFRSFEQSLYTAVSRSVRAGDERALNRIFWNIEHLNYWI
jgi:hypothetical protein